ncbi:STAS domain-containing protein [Myxococcota bacterium]|nr:STAS domain-containing protein [Myxococcota bacterium]MBU1382164.1 STAS domain-containing protein [Myxococcota bacterium]MBU1498746.1 STAS domain-containing protein [Myxococcota bacterium]
MDQKFNYTLKIKDKITYVTIIGIIDEDNNLEEIADRTGSGTVLLNLSHVERINSCGVRDWVNWLGKIESKGARVVLLECSPAIVAQINLVSNFTSKSVIQSFFAPYYCQSCDKEKVLLIESSTMKNIREPKAPISRCDECDAVMEFDDMEESYFAFLQTANLGPLPDGLPEGWEELINVESTLTSDKKVKTRERTLKSKASQPSLMSSLPGSLPGSSLPSLPSSSLPSLPGTRDSKSGTFSSLPSFPSGENAPGKSGSSGDSKIQGSNKQQTMMLAVVTGLFIIVILILIIVLIKIM